MKTLAVSISQSVRIESTGIKQAPPVFTFLDLFSGIGGFRIPLEKLGGKCLGYSEIDKQAIQVYQNNFLDSDEACLGDITKLDLLNTEIDIFTGGVPCQSWSIAGKGDGFKDPRGALWFKVIQLVEINKPKAFIFENVKGLAEPRNKDSLNYIINSLENAGYTTKYTVLNSYDFGLPQDRDRIFIVGISKNLENHHQFRFPEPLKHSPKISDCIDGITTKNIVKKKFNLDILFHGKVPGSRGRFQKNDELNDFFTFADIRDGHTTIHSWDIIPTTAREKLICYTILRNRRKKKYGEKDGNPLLFKDLKSLIEDLEESELIELINKSILKIIPNRGYEFVNSKISSGINGVAKILLPHADVVGTLTATGTRDYISTISIPCQEPSEYRQTFINEVYLKGNFRELSSKDYARLQGFPESFVMAKNEATAKKQFGNAVSIPVVYYLAQEVINMIR
jgi:DNA (cytosine-5)-methyltransferase 1